MNMFLEEKVKGKSYYLACFLPSPELFCAFYRTCLMPVVELLICLWKKEIFSFLMVLVFLFY